MLIEKLMSGLYMGDCARRLLLSFAQRANLFDGNIPEKLTQKDSFTTAGGLDDCATAAVACAVANHAKDGSVIILKVATAFFNEMNLNGHSNEARQCMLFRSLPQCHLS